jgi:hypothetical protein
MKKTYILCPMVVLAVACGGPDVPAERRKIAVVEFSVAPNAVIEDYGGNAASLGKSVAEAVAEEIRDDDAFDAQAIAQTVPPEGDLIVRGEITHVYGGNLAVRATVLVCWFCGWWKGDAVVGVQGEVVRRDGTAMGVFSEEKLGSAWGETSSVVVAAKAVGQEIGEMVKEGTYRGGHPGNDGYLAPVKLAEPAAERPPLKVAEPAAERLRALDSLRAQGLISDAEYAEKRKQILQEF